MTKLESSFAGLNNKNSHQRKEKKRWRWGVLVVVWPLLRKARLQEKALFAGLGRGANRKAAPTLFEADFSSVITKNYPRGLTHFPLCSSLRSSPAKPPHFTSSCSKLDATFRILTVFLIGSHFIYFSTLPCETRTSPSLGAFLDIQQPQSWVRFYPS